MKWRNRILLLCALTFALTVRGQDVEGEAVRPSGIAPGPVRKARAVTAKDKQDADVLPTAARKTRGATAKDKEDDEVSPSPARKTQTEKSTRARSHRTHAKPKEKPESTPAPTEYTPDGIPKTGAASVIVVDANSGQIMYEKNADAVRAAASTQKLLTALIIAERGLLDQPVAVQTLDTMADPVNLNIKPGDTYPRIELLWVSLLTSTDERAPGMAPHLARSE